MAGQMTHMEVAYRVAEKIEITEGLAEFILGSVAPDAISDTVPFWDKYGATETDEKRKMLLLGICVHCLTDHWNDLLIWRKAQKMCMPPLTRDEFKAVYYPDMNKVGLWLYQNSEHTPEIFRLLSESAEIEIGDYTHEEDLRDIKSHLINVQYNVSEPVDVSDCKYCTAEQMLEFIDIFTDRIVDRINTYKGLKMQDIA
jgi:hypothetical protein